MGTLSLGGHHGLFSPRAVSRSIGFTCAVSDGRPTRCSRMAKIATRTNGSTVMAAWSQRSGSSRIAARAATAAWQPGHAAASRGTATTAAIAAAAPGTIRHAREGPLSGCAQERLAILPVSCTAGIQRHAMHLSFRDLTSARQIGTPAPGPPTRAVEGQERCRRCAGGRGLPILDRRRHIELFTCARTCPALAARAPWMPGADGHVGALEYRALVCPGRTLLRSRGAPIWPPTFAATAVRSRNRQAHQAAIARASVAV